MLPEDYEDDNPDIEESHLLDVAGGDDGEYLPEQMQDGNNISEILVSPNLEINLQDNKYTSFYRGIQTGNEVICIYSCS